MAELKVGTGQEYTSLQAAIDAAYNHFYSRDNDSCIVLLIE